MATPWMGHPYRRSNNINGLDSKLNQDDEGYEVHTLGNPAVTRLQEAYVRKVIETVNDLDNVMYEISNESHGASTEWQYHMIRYIRECEASLPAQHPVWMSFQWDSIEGPGTDNNLFGGPADAVSPRGGLKNPAYRSDPPVADGAKVVIADTDHLWGIGGSGAWVWKSFLRGLHPIFMDPYKNSPHWTEPEVDPQWDQIRRAMGDTLRFAGRLDLASMTPTDDRLQCSTRYCMRNPGQAYLVYQAESGPLTLDVDAGVYALEWFDVETGETVREGRRQFRDGAHTLQPPIAGDVVVLLTREVE